MATLQNIGKLKYRGKDGQWHPLPVVVQDAGGGVSTISGKGAPTTDTRGEVNQLYRDEDTQRLYICTAVDGGTYTWAVVSGGGGTVEVDATLTQPGKAADAKAAGDAIKRKLDAPQVAQVGEVLTVEEVDTEGKPKKWKSAPVDPKSIKDMYYEGFDTIETWIHDPDNQHISENNITLSAGEQCTVRIGDDEYNVVPEIIRTGAHDYSMVLGTWDFSAAPFYFTIASEFGAEVAYGKLYTRLSDSVTAGTEIRLEKNFAHTIKEKYFPETIFTQKNAPVRFGDILKNSTTQGNNTEASGAGSHAEGNGTIASGDYSHTEGENTKTSGTGSHAEGTGTIASGYYSHAEGNNTKAIGDYSHAEGENTITGSQSQHVQGKRNIEDKNGEYSHIVGNGNSLKASNAHTLDWKGNAWYAGDVYVGSTSGTNKDEGSKILVTREKVEAGFGELTKLVGEELDKKLYAPTTAQPGQIVRVKSVDENGVITETEAVDMPSGGAYTLPIASPTVLGGVKPIAKTDAMTQNVGVDAEGALWTASAGDVTWELIREITLTESVNNVLINTDANGEPFSLKAAKVECIIKQDTSDPFTYIKINVNDIVVINNATNQCKEETVYFSFLAYAMGEAGIMSMKLSEVLGKNYNWVYTVEKMGYKYNKDYMQSAITNLNILPNDGRKALGIAGTEIHVYGVRA